MWMTSSSLLNFLCALATIGACHSSVLSGSKCELPKSDAARPHSVTITEFGAVGDGVTLNTKAFHNAMFYLHSFADKGGAQLFVPAGRWLTGSFGLISHLTLFLDKDAVIIGSTHSSDWPIVDPLPSYGRGRELPGPRHQSLIYGFNLTDVVVTGDNGTIDGQGNFWWEHFKKHTLNHTRPHLVEFMYSTNVVISNLTFVNSPFWTIHPVYCRQVQIQNLTILAPLDSPNTDGIDPDSSDNVFIKDCYVRTGDDLISIKSGWDEYGISFARPSTNINICGLSGETNSSAGIAIGSEMSGGISEVQVHGLRLQNTKTAVRLKTSPGRGGYVRNIYISNVVMNNVKTAIRFSSYYGEHPDEEYDPDALPVIDRITFENFFGTNAMLAGHLEGIKEDTYVNICLLNLTLIAAADSPWSCSCIQGYWSSVSPMPCELLSQGIPQSSCYLPSNKNPVPRLKHLVDDVM